MDDIVVGANRRVARVGIRLPPEVQAELEKMAKAEGISLNAIITRACRELVNARGG